MHPGLRRCLAGTLLASALLATAACSNPNALSSSGAAAAPPPVYDAWTTPPGPGSPVLAAQPAPSGSWQPAPQPVTTWSGAGVPPPPPPPSAPGVAAPCYPTAPAPVAAAPLTGRRVPTPAADDGCGLGCEDGISQWHARLVGGLATFHGDDPAENCIYYGADVGRTFCGCWGLDAYYRYNSGRFDRLTTPAGGGAAQTVKDGGEWHHVGAKLTYEKAFSQNGRLYAWGGLGGGYFWTNKYLFDDDGPEGFGEAGIGFVLSRNWRLRAGVNVHGMDTDVTRERAADTGRSRWLWLVAPVVEIEGDF